MKRISKSLLCIAALTVPGTVQAVAAQVTVLELFTSQGCSSCPAADALMQTMAADPAYLVLSYSVSYWDYLGWKDTFGLAANTERQQAYAQALGEIGVYTPQLVVGGRVGVPGSSENAVRNAVASVNKLAGHMDVPVGLALGGDTISVKVAAVQQWDGRTATVWLVTYRAHPRIDVVRGENAGHSIVYTNVIASMQPVGVWTGHAVEVSLPAEGLFAGGVDGAAVLVQVSLHGLPGPIIGAASLSRPHPVG